MNRPAPRTGRRPNRRELGLDLLNFFTANIQTGFGPFIASYLTLNKWTQSQIGLALSVGTVTSMLSQMPAGLLLDSTPYKRAATAAGMVSIALCAIVIGAYPARLPVMGAEILHGFASCVIGPSVAAISLALVGSARMGQRLGRNARWGAIGNGAAAALMWACGRYFSARAVFWLTALLALPAMLSLLLIGRLRMPLQTEAAAPDSVADAAPSCVADAAPSSMADAAPGGRAGAEWRATLALLHDRRVLGFALAAILFQVANADIMPLAAGRATQLVGANRATQIIAGATILPQMVMACIAPGVGWAADHWGRRLVLLVGFSSVPARALLLALLPAPALLVPIQALDGIGAAAFGVMLPLVAADATRGRGGFNLCIGVLGLASGGGGTLGTLLGGVLADRLGLSSAFLVLGAAGALACLPIWLLMPHGGRGRASA